MAMDAVFQEEKKALAKTEQIIEYAATELEKQIAKQNYSIENFVCVDYSDRQELAELRAETRRKQERADELRGYQESPYFGRMDLDVVGEDDTEVVYIGKTGIVIDHEFLVSDWRSPLGQYFYMKSERKFHAGQVDYILQLRRALDIKGGNLISYRTEFDGETVSLEGDVIDPFLLTVLKDKRRQNRLTDIIKTIQSNQNDIIRRPRSESFIVQGCAGSGKTMILLHRLSYLLFNYREISPDSIKVITPNSLFDAHINELSNELGLDRIERKSVEEFYVALIKGFSRKMDVSSEVSSEKGMSIDLLRYLYSEEYYRATCAHYDSYWSEILSKIEDLNLSGIASRLRIDFDIPSDHDYAAYSRLESSLRLLSSSISEEIAQRNRLVSQIEYFRDEKVKATDENERCARNLAEIAKSTSAFLENSISAQTAQLGNFSTAANDQEKRIAAWNQELRELEEARKKKREQLTAIQNEIINLTNYRTVSMRTDAFAVGLLSVLSKQVDEIKQFESDIQKTAVYNFGKRNRLRAQLADAIENFSKLAMTQVSSYLDAGVTEIKKADQRIEELRQIVENESRQYENGKTILANLRREIRVLSLCRGLFADSTYPDLRGLDRNTHNNMPHEMRRYEEAFKQVTNAKRRLGKR